MLRTERATGELPLHRLVACHGDWEHELFDAYGLDPDRARVDFYRAQWNAGDVSSH